MADSFRLLTTHKNMYISSTLLRLPYRVQEAMMPLPRLAEHAHFNFIETLGRAHRMGGNVVSNWLRFERPLFSEHVLYFSENQISSMRIGSSDSLDLVRTFGSLKKKKKILNRTLRFNFKGLKIPSFSFWMLRLRLGLCLAILKSVSFKVLTRIVKDRRARVSGLCLRLAEH